MSKMAKSILLTAFVALLAVSLAACSWLAPRETPLMPPGQPSQSNSEKHLDRPTGNLTVRFLDVGQGDSIFITFPDNTCMLIDAGTRGAGDKVVAAVKESDMCKLDHFVLTHPHEDHIGGAVAVLEAFEVDRVWMPRTSHTTKTYENLLLAIRDKGLGVDEAKAGKTILDGENLRAWLLNPTKTHTNLNDMSAVLALTYCEHTFLFSGDAESEAELAMLADSSVPAGNVLKIGHHGSSTSTTDAFLGQVKPQIAVISVGADNSYGHPAQVTLDKLAQNDVQVYRTDLHGTVTITSDGVSLTVQTEKNPVTPSE